MEAIREQLQTILRMDLRDMIDIFLVAFLIYRVMLLVRTTASMRIFRGIVAVLAVAALTQILELRTLNFILGQILAVGLLAMVILFQPELRRMMDHLGSSVSLSRFLNPENKPFVRRGLEPCCQIAFVHQTHTNQNIPAVLERGCVNNDGLFGGFRRYCGYQIENSCVCHTSNHQESQNRCNDAYDQLIPSFSAGGTVIILRQWCNLPSP